MLLRSTTPAQRSTVRWAFVCGDDDVQGDGVCSMDDVGRGRGGSGEKRRRHLRMQWPTSWMFCRYRGAFFLAVSFQYASQTRRESCVHSPSIQLPRQAARSVRKQSELALSCLVLLCRNALPVNKTIEDSP